MKESRVQLKRVGFPFKKHVKTQNKFWGVRNMISENLFSVSGSLQKDKIVAHEPIQDQGTTSLC